MSISLRAFLLLVIPSSIAISSMSSTSSVISTRLDMLNDNVATPLVVPPLRPEFVLVLISVISPVAAAGGVYVNCLADVS